MKHNIKVHIQNATEQLPLPSDADFAHWVQLAMREHREDGEVTIRLVDAEESQTLNQQYRHKNKPTNVLSFPFEAFDDLELVEPIIGDLVICAPLVAAEALEQKKELLAHWAHLTIHGSLHLLGYDHEIDAEAELMEALETELLQQLGYSNPYV
jgi:probable rRNA maturation factor